MVSSHQLRYSYKPERIFEFPDIYCEGGKSLLILGPSGCGKSTLLHLLSGIIKPKSGSIKIMGTEVVNLASSKIDAFRGLHIGVILQKPYFISSLNVFENLQVFQSLSDRKGKPNLIMELLESLGLHGKEKQMTNTLSQGEAQRLSFARALINRPSLILADEPTSALDDKNTTIMASILNEQATYMNAALVIVTHDKRLQSIFTDNITMA